MVHFATSKLPNIQYDYEHFKFLPNRLYKGSNTKIFTPPPHLLTGVLSTQKPQFKKPEVSKMETKIIEEKMHEEVAPPIVLAKEVPPQSKPKIEVVKEEKYIPNYSIKENDDHYSIVVVMEACDSIKDIIIDVSENTIQLSGNVYDALIKLKRSINRSLVKAKFSKATKCLTITTPYL